MEVTPRQSLSLAIAEPSILGEARRAAALFAERLDLDRRQRDAVPIVVTEAVNNVLKHARSGELLLQQSPFGDLDMLVLDRGPGMSDPGRCMQDGYSTGGTSGNGLGAIARLSSRIDLHSAPGVGTALFCRFSPAERPQDSQTGETEFAAINVAKHGERLCGDSWAVRHAAPDRTVIMVADGLGHGPIAAEASREAEAIFAEHWTKPPELILPVMHDALRKTRGAAVAIAELDHARRAIHYAGAGNISGIIVATDGVQRSMVSQNGTVGYEMRKVQSFDYPWPPGSILIMYSDGLVSNLRWERYNGLLTRNPMLIAGVIYRDFSRQRDDVTAVVLR